MRSSFLSFAVAAAVSLAVACSSSSSGGGGGSSDVSSACYGQCDAQSKATNCGSGGLSLAECHQLCDDIIPRLSADCQQKAKASWSCGASATWQCAPGGNVPLEQATACEAQNQAYADCLSPSDAGGGG